MRGEKQKSTNLTAKQNIFQVLKFVLFSISAGVIQAIVFTIMNETMSLPYWPCYLTALIASVIYNFTVNRKFTFKSANNVPIAMLKVALFYLVFTPFSTWWGQALADRNWNHYLILGFTMIINLTTEFIYSRYVTFRGSINTNKLGQKENEKYLKKDNEQSNNK